MKYIYIFRMYVYFLENVYKSIFLKFVDLSLEVWQIRFSTKWLNWGEKIASGKPASFY